MALAQYPGNLDGLKGYYFPNMGSFQGFSTGYKRRGGSAVTSVNTPGWASMSKEQRRNAPWHPHTYSFEQWDFYPGTVSGKNGPSSEATYVGYAFAPKGILWTDGWSFVGTYTNWPSEDSQVKALGKLQGLVSAATVNLAQAFAERKQTTSLIAKSIRRVVQLALWIKKGDFKSIHKRYGLPKPVKTRSGGYVVPQYRRETTKIRISFDERGNPLPRPRTVYKTTYRDRERPGQDFAFGDVWLEYQYGWKPLLSDIQGSAEALAQTHLNPRPLRFSAMASTNGKVMKRPIAIWPVNGTHYLAELTFYHAGKTRYVLEVAEDSKILESLQTVGLTNPLLLAWELLPYSFVVDWFLPLGSYLQQLEYARGLTFIRGSVSTSFTAVGSIASRFYEVTPGYLPGRIAGLEIDVSYRRKSRAILSSFPYQKLPSFQPKLGVERCLSGIALLQQIFTRGKTTVRQ